MKELESVQSFLYRHFKDTPYYKQMLPSLNQPARFFDSAKTHKFDNLSDINVTNLKLDQLLTNEDMLLQNRKSHIKIFKTVDKE